MPRTARIVLPNYPHHVVHKEMVFAKKSDFERYLVDFQELKTVFDVKVTHFVL